MQDAQDLDPAFDGSIEDQMSTEPTDRVAPDVAKFRRDVDPFRPGAGQSRQQDERLLKLGDEPAGDRVAPDLRRSVGDLHNVMSRSAGLSLRTRGFLAAIPVSSPRRCTTIEFRPDLVPIRPRHRGRGAALQGFEQLVADAAALPFALFGVAKQRTDVFAHRGEPPLRRLLFDEGLHLFGE
ncbi:hypothetical protein PZE19_21110 [Paludisphaera sp. Pla2]|uniref:N-acetyltransferase domain-containing protein n=1 Tax=Paludisphaera mucosa TaxID=3030827 RepID=A0ABT6FFB7_9BACT|nr:hypothetical protein [Paludisphaera mucosa]MDG3006277.1 hypothetical protein [Paludisphaera mucosa]